MKKSSWFFNLSLRKKLLVLLALVGLVPLSITFIASYREIRGSTLQSQNYAANQNYEQTLATLSGKLAGIEKMSTIIILNEALEAALSADPETTDIGKQILDFEKISTFTRVLEESSGSNNIVYYIDDRFVVSGTDTRFRKYKSIEDRAWARKIKSNGGAPTWVVYQDESSPAPQTYLALGRVLWNTNDFSDSIGIVAINLDLRSIRQSLTKSVPEQLVYLADEAGSIIASNEDAQPGSLQLPRMPDTGGSFKEVKVNSGLYLVRSNQIGDTGIRLIAVIPKAAASAAVNKVETQMIAVYALVGVSLLIFIFPITGSITSRVFMLTRKMDQIRSGQLRTLDIEPREDEVGRLVSSYNFMINSLQQLLQEQFRLGEEKKGAELKALQSQINPHFLYNTLDMLNWMAHKEERENIQKVIYALSDYYKLILNKGEDFVTVEEELRLSSIYVEIQQKRFKGKIKFEIDVEEEARACRIPKITLQPLVENAIVHGISEKPEGMGMISIKGAVRNQRMILSVNDDGVGLTTEPKQQADYHGSGYGVKNIEKRLELYYGEQNCMRFESTPGAGTAVVIDVPVLYVHRKLQGIL